MNPLYLALAMPIFFGLIGLELLVLRLRRQEAYRFHDAVTDLSCGVGSVVHGAFTKLVALGIYSAVWSAAGVMDLSETSPAAWVLAFVGVDLCYYWHHRAGHRVHLLWTGHAVHHQSEDYNLAVALRQPWYPDLVTWVFYLPLALLGVPPLLYITAKTLNTLYQFWIHTELVGRLGPLEWVLNTPSHHRVHHGVNPRYIDKNYGGILIVWDRLFGTFEAEREEPVYGVVEPFRSYNPLWANIKPLVELCRLSTATKSFADKLRLWLGPPDWRPADLGGPVSFPEVSRAAQVKYEVRPPGRINLYVGASFVTLLAGSFLFLLLEPTLTLLELGGFGAVIIAALTAWGGLFHARPWAVPLELLRLAAMVGVAAWLASGTPWQLPATSGAALLAVLGAAGLLFVRPKLRPSYGSPLPATAPAPPPPG